jgi:hypothetical protein
MFSIGRYASRQTLVWLLETVLKDICRMGQHSFFLAVMIPQPTEIDTQAASHQRRERKKNCLVQCQMSMQGAAKWRHAVFPAPLSTKAQDAYDKLNCVGGEGYNCSSACLQSLLLGSLPC